MLYWIFLLFHLIPMLQSDVQLDLRDEERRARGIVQMIFFHIITFLLCICYLRSILEHPGEIPDNDPNWSYPAQDGRSSADDKDKQGEAGLYQEIKRTGERRHCKWCG